MKPVTFAALKKIQGMTLNQFNRWVEVVYKHGVQDGIDFIEEETVAEIRDDDLYALLLSVKGIGPGRASEIMKKIIGEEWECEE